jgi:hypothetical protein
MTTLEIILITVIWVMYGVFNSWQHNWHKAFLVSEVVDVLGNIIFAPIAIIVRIIRGVLFWRGDYCDLN